MIATFKVRYVQEIELGDGSGFRSTDDNIEAVFSKRAATNGLLAQMQKREAGSAGMVLITLSLYTRPLVGEEFQLLHAHGLVTGTDEGRLFCWLTRQGLAEILDTKWDTVDRALKWLIAHDVVREVEMPPDFVTRFVQSRGQFASNVIYMLNTNGLLRNQWVDVPGQPSAVTVAEHAAQAEEALPVTVPVEGVRSFQPPSTVPVERVRSPQTPPTVPVEGGWSSPLNGDTVPLKGVQSILNTSTTFSKDPRAETDATLQTAVGTAWQSYMGSPLDKSHVVQLARLVAEKQTSLALITALLRTVRQDMGTIDPDLFLGILTGTITNLPWEGPATGTSPPAENGPTPVLPVNFASEDPILAQVARWYEQEIGQPLTQMSADEIRDLTSRYQNLDAWKQAFTKAAATPPGIPRWRYVIACMEDTNGQFSLERRSPERRPPQPSGRNGGAGQARSGSGPATRRKRSSRSSPPVKQYTAEEQAQINAAAGERLPDLEAQAREALAAMGIDLDAKLRGGGRGSP